MKGLKSTDNGFLLEAGLENLHLETISWASEIELWEKELDFFQKLLDTNSQKFSKEEKKRLDHFQNLIIYYSDELLIEFALKARLHEKYLASQLEKGNKLDEAEYRTKHSDLKKEIEAFKKQFYDYKHDFFAFVSAVL